MTRLIYLLARSHHLCCRKHCLIGVAEKAIQDVCNILKCLIAEGNIPPKYWDLAVGELATLIKMMTSPSICNPDITIFKESYGSLPNLDLLPIVGCFAVRLKDKGFRLDQKLDPVNQVCIFLGFATYEDVYGSKILTSNHSIVTTKYQVTYDNDLMPLVSSDASNP